MTNPFDRLSQSAHAQLLPVSDRVEERLPASAEIRQWPARIGLRSEQAVASGIGAAGTAAQQAIDVARPEFEAAATTAQGQAMHGARPRLGVIMANRLKDTVTRPTVVMPVEHHEVKQAQSLTGAISAAGKQMGKAFRRTQAAHVSVGGAASKAQSLTTALPKPVGNGGGFDAVRQSHAKHMLDINRRQNELWALQKGYKKPPGQHQFGHKLAATRQVKMMRGMFNTGKVDEAAAFSKRLSDAGALKISGPGTQIKHLGGGAEGMATVVAGAKDAPRSAFAVRKAYDPKGALYSPETLADKFNVGRNMRGNEPDVAELYSKRIGRGSRGGRYTVHEHVRGQELGDPTGMDYDAWNKARERTKRVADAPLGAPGRKVLMDVDGHPGNTLMKPDGSVKVIDYIPARKSDVSELEHMHMQGGAFLGPREKQMGVNIQQHMQQRMQARGADPWDVHASDMSPRDTAQATWIGRRQHARNFNSFVSGARVAPSDITQMGIRRADTTRALRGL